MRDMQQDPELDDLAEEIIFGRTTKEFDDIYTKRWRFKRRDDEKEANYWFPSQPYSSTWNGLGLVLEEMQRRKWDYRIETHGGAVTVAFFRRLEGAYAEVNGDEKMKPYVATMAAIKALAETTNSTRE
ncbi:MAG: hypothetical protein K0Q73_7236 [Paenibacillus sp.]|jgi:hypothetical protein|nr:hypothetical protein [Paenibacillus sp.]